jgi:hypothetical protein
MKLDGITHVDPFGLIQEFAVAREEEIPKAFNSTEYLDALTFHVVRYT